MFLMPSTLTVTEEKLTAKCLESVFVINANNTHIVIYATHVADLNKPVRDTHLINPSRAVQEKGLFY